MDRLLRASPHQRFFLLLDPEGRDRLTTGDKHRAMAAMVIGGVLLRLLYNLPRELGWIFDVALAYPVLFALCVYLPKWSDALRPSVAKF